jgi:hypothetical protein
LFIIDENSSKRVNLFHTKQISILSLFIIFSLSACSRQASKVSKCDHNSTLPGAKLASMQCYYYGEERVLLQDITMNMKKQLSLAKVTNEFNKEMTLLYNETNELKKEKHISLLEQEVLDKKIEKKKDIIYTLQKLNKNIIYDSTTHLKSLQDAKFSEVDKKSIETSLHKVVKNLHQIEKASTYNLEQLQLFQKL